MMRAVTHVRSRLAAAGTERGASPWGYGLFLAALALLIVAAVSLADNRLLHLVGEVAVPRG